MSVVLIKKCNNLKMSKDDIANVYLKQQSRGIKAVCTDSNNNYITTLTGDFEEIKKKVHDIPTVWADTATTLLEYHRKRKGITQKQLAELSTVRIQSISRFETGERDITQATCDTAIKLANALGVSLTDILVNKQNGGISDVICLEEDSVSMDINVRLTAEELCDVIDCLVEYRDKSQIDKISKLVEKLTETYKKTTQKKQFNRSASIQYRENGDSTASESCYLTFCQSSKPSEPFIYIKDYKSRMLGYIDYYTGEVKIVNTQGIKKELVDNAILKFAAEYNF